jgi:hypothetical protein
VPFTPFHFGPALLLKGVWPGWFSFSAFVASQVAIDLETLYWLYRGEWPVHRYLHTLLGGAVVGSGVALAVSLVLRRLARRFPSARANLALVAEAALGPALAGGLVGGLSHALLDGIMHWDVQPFRPVAAGNPLLELLNVVHLHVGCAAAGLLGGLLLLGRVLRRRGI